MVFKAGTVGVSGVAFPDGDSVFRGACYVPFVAAAIVRDAPGVIVAFFA